MPNPYLHLGRYSWLKILEQAAATTAALAKKYEADITVVGMCTVFCPYHFVCII